MVIAYQADITRVSTLHAGRELSNRTYPQIGVPEPHHAVSHHGNDPSKIDEARQDQHLSRQLLAGFSRSCGPRRTATASLLDHSMMVYGSGMANGNQHSHNPLWLLLAGGGNAMKGNRHIKAKDETPLGNALVGLAARAGVDVEQIGMSNGRFEI